MCVYVCVCVFVCVCVCVYAVRAVCIRIHRTDGSHSHDEGAHGFSAREHLGGFAIAGKVV